MSSYKDHHPVVRGEDGVYTQDVTHSWDAFTARRLIWHYGPERAAAITTGQDPATEADVAAWNALGRRAVAA